MILGGSTTLLAPSTSTESLNQAGQGLEDFVNSNIQTGVAVGTVLVGAAINGIREDINAVASVGSHIRAWVTGALIKLGGGKPPDMRDRLLEDEGGELGPRSRRSRRSPRLRNLTPMMTPIALEGMAVSEKAGAAPSLGRFISNAGFRVLMWFSPRRVLVGVPVVLVQGEEGVEDSFFEKVEAALTCIHRYDPRTHQRVTRYLTRIVGAELDGPYGWYWHNLKAAFVSPKYVLESSPEALAMTIVHEAAHGRIRQTGVQIGGVKQPKVEAVCIRAELRFAERVPGIDGLLEEAVRRRQIELSRME